MVDEGELFHDLLNNRLICWTLDQKGSNAAAVVSAPWDSRSWEAQPWFLRKWWILVGGTEGEMYQQTIWWREMRGESTADLLPNAEPVGLHVYWEINYLLKNVEIGLFVCVRQLSEQFDYPGSPSGALETGSCLNLQSSHLTHWANCTTLCHPYLLSYGAWCRSVVLVILPAFEYSSL